MPQVSLYQLFDLTAELAAGPIMAQHRDAPAIRDFHAILADKNTQPGRYPEHFILLKLGQQDTETGQINAIDPETIATGEAWAIAQDMHSRADKLEHSAEFNANEALTLSPEEQRLNNRSINAARAMRGAADAISA